jgi:hypothetical protein
MSRAGFETTIPVFELSNTVRALDRAASGTGLIFNQKTKITSKQILDNFKN